MYFNELLLIFKLRIILEIVRAHMLNYMIYVHIYVCMLKMLLFKNAVPQLKLNTNFKISLNGQTQEVF